MTPTTPNTLTQNVLYHQWLERGAPAEGQQERATEVSLAIAGALGSNPTRTKFLAAFASGSRVRRANNRRDPPKTVQDNWEGSPAHVEHAERGANGGIGGQVQSLLQEPATPLADAGHSGESRPRSPGLRPNPTPPHPHTNDKSGADRRVEYLKRRLLGLRGQPPEHLPEGATRGSRWLSGPYSLPLSMEGSWRTWGNPGRFDGGRADRRSLEGILVKGKGGKRSRMQADLEDRLEIVGAEDKEEYYRRYKGLRPLQMTTAWNSVHAYADYAYKEDTSLLPAIPVELETPENRGHINLAAQGVEREVPRKAPGMRHRILVIEGATGTRKTAFAWSKGMHSRMCNVWNVGALSEDADIWILDNMVHTNGRYWLKALSQYEANFTGRYKHVKTMKVRPSIILGNSQATIMKCWSDIEGEEGDAWVEGNVDWVYAGQEPFFVFPRT